MTLADAYNKHYERKNYFAYREWIYRPYIRSLLRVAGLGSGSSVLDVGCGQGFFSYLLRRCGMKVCGLDVSEIGVRSATAAYGSLGIDFIVGDASRIPLSQKFDCVFTRSLSLYNCDDFAANHTITDNLLSAVGENGVFIFLYNTRLDPSSRAASWRYHSVEDARKHFSCYRNHKVFFVSKIDTVILGRRAFNALPLTVNSFISRRFGLGGDLVGIVRKNDFTSQIK